MFLTLISCLLFTINVNCDIWDGYHRQIDDELPAISWKDCGISARKSDPTLIPEVSTRIQGGESAQSGEFPWYALLYIHATGGGALKCGGSIINEWWILTAAHCIEKSFMSDAKVTVDVTVGAINASRAEGEGRKIEVQTIIPHKLYVKYLKEEEKRRLKNEILKEKLIQWEITDRERNKNFEDHLSYYKREARIIEAVGKNSWFYDIALLKLKERIFPAFNETHYTINSICLPKTGIVNTKNESMFIIGMGAQSHTLGDNPKTLKKGVVLLMDPKICGNRNSSDGITSVVCSRRDFRQSLPLFDSSVCRGDSGGPTHQYYGWQAVQIGVTIIEYSSNNLCGMQALYERVSLFMPWIRSFISGNSSKQTGTDVRLEADTNHLLIVSVIIASIIAVLLSSAFLWILVKILRDRHRNRNV